MELVRKAESLRESFRHKKGFPKSITDPAIEYLTDKNPDKLHRLSRVKSIEKSCILVWDPEERYIHTLEKKFLTPPYSHFEDEAFSILHYIGAKGNVAGLRYILGRIENGPWNVDMKTGVI